MANDAPPSPCHMLVLTHGMWGNPLHVRHLERIIQDTIPGPDLHVLRAQTNREENTYDGIDWGGERVAVEIVDEVAKLQREGRTVTRFSITGYSLGGLVARYVVGILHQRGFFEHITPVNFNTIATPHIGVPRYPSFLSSLASFIGPRLLSRTGEQFFCVDKWSPNGRALLEVMADPDRIFYQALAAFETIRIYANAINDMTVPYMTAAIEVEDPFIARASNGLEVELDDKYTPLVKSFSVPLVPPPPTPKPAVLSRSWFKSLKLRPFVPPPLQFRFPLNLVVYTLLPLLIPAFMSLAICRLAVASRSSRARIRLLERDAASPGSAEKLAHVLARLEQQVESAVVDLINEPTTMVDSEQATSKTRPAGKDYPRLTQAQRRIAANLNTLPLKKELAFLPNLRNAHGTIVCRDLENFEFQRQGEGIVRHWASVFVL